MDRLEAMRIFVTVVNRQGFAVAARELGVGVATVSKAVAALESHLGVALLNRTTRRLNITSDGELYLEWCSRILADLEEAETVVRHKASQPGGRIRIAAPMVFGQMHLARQVCDFMTRYPNIIVQLDLNDRYVDVVTEGFDLAVRIGRLEDSSLRNRRLAPFGLRICATPSYLARHGEPATPDELASHLCLVYTLSSREEVGIWRFEGGDGRRYRIRVKPVLLANNSEVLKQAALAGLGIAILPSFLVEAEMKQGELQEILTSFRPQGGGIYAVYPPSLRLPVRARLFIDHLAERWRHGIFNA